MNLHEIIESKRHWRQLHARVRNLPEDYRVAYGEIQKYLYKVGPAPLAAGDTDLLEQLVTLFEHGAAEGKGVIELIGTDVAAFCDGLIAGMPTVTDSVINTMRAAQEKSLEQTS